MSWIGWTVIIILSFNLVFFAALAIIAYVQDRRHK